MSKKQDLNSLLYDIKRIQEHRVQLTDKKIQKIYKQLMKDLDAFLSEGYKKFADQDGRLYLNYLDENRQRAFFLQQIVDNVDNITPQLKKQMENLIDDTYTACYVGMENSIKNAYTSGEIAELVKDMNVRPEVIEQAVNNNISKLTLPAVMENHRAVIVYQIQRELMTGLLNGDRYETMSKRIQERINVSEGKARRIVRTEAHRNVEGGFMEFAEYMQGKFEGSGLIYACTWHTMRDEKVRPQQRRKVNGKWVTTFSKNGADHMKMEGQTVKAGEYFDLGGGVKTKAPSLSGDAKNDCNCRCTLEYNIMTMEEFKKATGKNVSIVAMSKANRQKMNENGIVNLGLEQTTNSDRFDMSITLAKKANANGACVDLHDIEELDTFKLILAKDGMAGVAVKPDGDITAVFKNSNSSAKGAVNDLIITARANGGEKMDCYGQFLVNAYEKCGYKPVARIPFNADYVDDPFLLKNPMDVYAMMKNGDDIETVIEKNAKKAYKLSTQEALDNLPTFEDYDEALKYRDNLLKKQNKKK